MLKVAVAAPVAANVPFRIVVPGTEVWTVRSVFATVSRAVGGTPNRAYQLTLSDGTNTFVTTPAADAGTEPGTCSVTWTNATPASVASGSTGISLGPLAAHVLPPGYIITGTVLNGVVTDQWTLAVAWVDFDYSGR